MKAAERIFAEAIACLRAKDFGSAERLLAKVLRIVPDHIPSLLNLAITQLAQAKLRDAENTLAKVIGADPGNIDAWIMLARLLLGQSRYSEAIKAFDQIERRNPAILEVYCNKAAALNEIGRYREALESARAALKLNARHVESHLNHGNALFNMARYEEARGAYRLALELDPNNIGSLLGLANSLVQLMHYDEALSIYAGLLSNFPNLEAALVGRATLNFDLRRYQDALSDYESALALRPDLAQAWLGRGDVQVEIGQYVEALVAYDRALSLKPDLAYADGARLRVKMHMCEWTNLEAEIRHVLSPLRDGKPSIAPFILLSTPSSPEDQLQCAKILLANRGSPVAPRQRLAYSHERIRVAYLSADFHEHATAHLIAGLFEQHERSRFDVAAISFGPKSNSEMRQRIMVGVDQFFDVSHQSDQQIAALVRQLEIDIAVDLNGFTQGARFNLLAQRPAPLQVSYLGYPGTMGADYIDYIIADPTVIPEEEFTFFSERVVWLPDSYQVNDRQRRTSDRAPSRQQCALPDGAFVFCCFNSPHKILPEIFDAWMRLLRAHEDSVLWLIEGHPAASANLRCEAEKRGVAAGRLIFAPRMPSPDHLARHRHADLFLDTLPYNAHTTASDALWAGVPVLTCLGTTFAGRVGASLLNAVGLEELITHSLEDYEALALKLARDSAALASLKARLARNRESRPLFDTERFARHIESAYATMWECYRRGEPPRTFAVVPHTMLPEAAESI